MRRANIPLPTLPGPGHKLSHLHLAIIQSSICLLSVTKAIKGNSKARADLTDHCDMKVNMGSDRVHLGRLEHDLLEAISCVHLHMLHGPFLQLSGLSKLLQEDYTWA